jgi:hypothetical protein
MYSKLQHSILSYYLVTYFLLSFKIALHNSEEPRDQLRHELINSSQNVISTENIWISSPSNKA